MTWSPFIMIVSPLSAELFCTATCADNADARIGARATCQAEGQTRSRTECNALASVRLVGRAPAATKVPHRCACRAASQVAAGYRAASAHAGAKVCAASPVSITAHVRTISSLRTRKWAPRRTAS